EDEGKQKGDLYRANQKETTELATQVANYEIQIATHASAENDRVKYASEISQHSERLEILQSVARDWDATRKKRLKEVNKFLASGKYAVDEQKQLARLDNELAKLGYDASAHDNKREKESELRSVNEEFSSLKAASEVSKQIEGDISSLRAEIENRMSEIENLEKQYQNAKGNLES